jgi:hypothetical protein
LSVSKRRLRKQRPELRKNVLGSIPSEDGSCSLDTNHDRRTAPRPKLFCFEEEIIETNATTPKTVLGSSPDEEVLCSSKTQTYEKNGAKAKFVCFGEEIAGIKVTNPKTVMGSSL